MNKEEMHGYGQGDHMALVGNLPVQLEEFNQVLLGFSCYAPALPKIERCLRESQRYECVVMTGLREKHDWINESLAPFGVKWEVVSLLKSRRENVQKHGRT